MEFARQLQATVDPAIKDRDQRMYEAKEKALADGVVSRNAWEKAPLTASSDSGGVSQMMPMNLFTAVCWPLGVAPHTWQSCASAGSTIGQKGAFYAAKVIAATAYDLYTQPELRKEIQDEFDAQDREPYAPDAFHWTKGKELVLSSGYVIAKEPDCIEKAFREGSVQKSAGMMIKRERYLEKIPEEILELFDQYEVPLISMPFSAPWMEVMSQINTAVLNRTIRRLRINTSHMTFQMSNFSYKEQKIKRILQAMEAEMGFPAFLYDFVAHMRMKLDEFDDYKDSVLYLKDRYKKQIEIRFGLEAEYFPKYMDWLLDFCIENEIDYLIFGNHYYGTDEDHIYLGGAKGKYIKGYFDTCVEGMKTGMYAYLAHPELILRSTGGVITPEIEEGFHRICKTSQDYNVPLEFNVLGMQHNLRMGYEEYPHSRFWQIAGQYDVKAIIGMDAHEVGDLNKKWYDFALEKLSEFDVEIIDDIPSINYKKSHLIKWDIDIINVK